MMRYRTIWLLLCLAPLSCDETGDNYIEGSLAKKLKIDFDDVRVRLYESELSIEYIEKDGDSGEKVSLRVTVRVSAALVEGGSYDLKSSGTVSRGAGYGSSMPELTSGELSLDDFTDEDGSTASGEFKALFTTDDKTQYTLRGGFNAKLEVVM
jgi:hypothetical protein